MPFKRHANTGWEAQRYLVLSFLLHRFFLGNLIICSSFICIFILLFFYNISSSCCRSLRRRSIIARMQIPRNSAVQTLCTSFQVVIAFVLLAECICLHCKIYLSQLKKTVSKLGCKFAEADRSRLGIDQLGLSALPWSLSSPFQK